MRWPLSAISGENTGGRTVLKRVSNRARNTSKVSDFMVRRTYSTPILHRLYCLHCRADSNVWMRHNLPLIHLSIKSAPPKASMHLSIYRNQHCPVCSASRARHATTTALFYSRRFGRGAERKVQDRTVPRGREAQAILKRPQMSPPAQHG